MSLFPGYTPPQTAAAWPVWRDSTTQPITFQPIPRKAAIRLYHQARDLDRQTHRPGSGKNGGILGLAGLAVLYTLIFDFLNRQTGRLDPGYAAIARAANVSQRTVATALKRLKELGILHWIRRCTSTMEDGRFVLRQLTNAYALLPATQWRGYRPPAVPEPPPRDTLGYPPVMPSVLDAAGAVRKAGGTPAEQLKVLALGDSPIERALASLGRTMEAESGGIARTAPAAE